MWILLKTLKFNIKITLVYLVNNYLSSIAKDIVVQN